MNRFRITILLLAVLSVALGSLAAGCGGGGEEATSPAGGAAGASSGGAAGGGAAPPPVTTTATAQNKDEITKPAQFIPTAETPDSFKKALKQKKPICVEFYLPGDPVTSDVNREMKAVKKDFGSQVIFLSYDVNNPSQTAAISAELGAGYEPYFVTLDKAHYVVYRHSGYIDRLTLSQALFSTLRR